MNPIDAQTKHILPFVTQYIYLDHINRRGRRLTMIALAVAAVLLGLLLAWFAARRIHIVLVNQADRQFAARQYQQAEQRYSQALIFDRSDARALLQRGLARQQINADIDAAADFTRYIELLPAEPA